MTFKRFMARAASGGVESENIRAMTAQAQALRHNDSARAIFNAASEEVARENRTWVLPALIICTLLQGTAGYYLRNVLDPWVSIAITIGVNAFLWRSLCVPERR